MAKRDRTRQHIIEQSAILFNKKGFAGTSLSDIIEATGLAKGGIYGNFEHGKIEIAIEAFEFAVQYVTDAVRQRTALKTTSYDKLLEAISFYRQYAINPPIEGGCPILNIAPEADDTLPELKIHVTKALDNWRNAIIRVLERGLARGEVNPSIVPYEFATLFVAMLEGGILLSRTYNNDPRHLHIVLNRLERIVREEVMPPFTQLN